MFTEESMTHTCRVSVFLVTPQALRNTHFQCCPLAMIYIQGGCVHSTSERLDSADMLRFTQHYNQVTQLSDFLKTFSCLINIYLCVTFMYVSSQKTFCNFTFSQTFFLLFQYDFKAVYLMGTKKMSTQGQGFQIFPYL